MLYLEHMNTLYIQKWLSLSMSKASIEAWFFIMQCYTKSFSYKYIMYLESISICPFLPHSLSVPISVNYFPESFPLVFIPSVQINIMFVWVQNFQMRVKGDICLSETVNWVWSSPGIAIYWQWHFSMEEQYVPIMSKCHILHPSVVWQLGCFHNFTPKAIK